VAARHAGELVHLKTAGTSYLEALRVLARVDPLLFREILAHARCQYEQERRSYHVSAELARVPAPEAVSDEQLPELLEDFDARQVLHVTFGAVLSATDGGGRPRFRERLHEVLQAHEEEHWAALEAHLARHLEAFSGQRRAL